MIRIQNLSNGNLIADKGICADSFLTRLRGLLGRKTFRPGQALLIRPCKSVHCVGMKIAIDVVFVSAENEVVYIIENMKPYRFSPYVRKAAYVVELPAGRATATTTRVGDMLSITALE